jgi:hypothetical protein
VIEAERPTRLVTTFDARWDDEVAPDAPSRVTWEIGDGGPGVCRLTVVHDEFQPGSATAEQFDGGMPFILSGLKTLLETGSPLVPATAGANATARPSPPLPNDVDGGRLAGGPRSGLRG